MKYGDLQHNLTTASEDLAESKAVNELLDGERERLAQHVEDLEAKLRAQEARPSRPVVPPLTEKTEPEVFELEIVPGEEEDAEEIVLLEDEATAPGSKDPRKP